MRGRHSLTAKGKKLNPARHRLYDNGGKTADRYTLIDSKLVDDGTGNMVRIYWSFDSKPWSPQGIWMPDQFTAAQWAAFDPKRLGKRIYLEDLPADLRKYIVNEFKKAGDDPTDLRGHEEGGRVPRSLMRIGRSRKTRKPARRTNRAARRWLKSDWMKSPGNPPKKINVIHPRHGLFKSVTLRGDTQWRDAKDLKGKTMGTLIPGSVNPNTVYQTYDNVTSAHYKVPGYRHHVIVWFDNRTGQRMD
jgi:hypothetical protein